MITLKAPIELKTRTDFVKDNDAFGERIAGNYTLMGLEIGAEELLHIVNAPPEIYIAEGGATTIVGNTLISSRNEEKLDIINNMLNRIMLSVNTGLTYQDRAYITDTLYKLGIRDDRRFMNEVRQIMNESRLEEDFISDYLAVSIEQENRELRSETIRLSREIVERGLENGVRNRDEYLSRSIMHRLQTGAIYQIVANFNKSLNETRIDLAEQMVSEQENIAKKLLVQNFLTNMEREGVELIYREEGYAAEEGAEEGTVYERARDTESVIRTEREREASTETVRTERETSVQTGRETVRLEGAEIIYREEAAPAEASGEEAVPAGRVGENVSYISSNVYERDIINESRTETSITESVGAAVLLDVIKNLFHTGYERINRGETWIEYRGALYRSSENTLNRVSYQTNESYPVTSYSTVNEGDIGADIDYTSFDELYEIEENEGNIELIENELREINENNLKNVERYEQMLEVLKQLKPERKAVDGKQRTRREALSALEDSSAILESFNEAEDQDAGRRREVFHEITRLFPDNAAQVFNVLEQYLTNPEGVRGVEITGMNASQAAEEIMRLQMANRREPEPEQIQEAPHAEQGLIHKREERLSADELEEIMESYRLQENRQQQEITNTRDITENRTINTTTINRTTDQNLTEKQLEDIEDMVNRGVRSQMGAISEQVMMKLEKRLRNEKNRRGL